MSASVFEASAGAPVISAPSSPAHALVLSCATRPQAAKAHGQNKHSGNFTKAEDFRAVYLVLNVLALTIIWQAASSTGRLSVF